LDLYAYYAFLLVPTSGKPLRGIIQDHVVGGVMLTRRDSYLCKSEVCTLLYVGMRAALEGGDLSNAQEKTKPVKRLKSSCKRHFQKLRVTLDEPAVMKPRKMWTGKQVLTMLLKHLLVMCGKEHAIVDGGINFDSKSKTPGDIWNGKFDGDKEESTVIFRGTELLMGVLDKNQFGATAYSLVHLIFELVLCPTFHSLLADAWLHLRVRRPCAQGPHGGNAQRPHREITPNRTGDHQGLVNQP
jgi:DNA-directed RNA polymerase I subunit RPA1